ncbi:T6SS immunity protein Tli4 family protein [Cupriavidus sp. SZY C1]|uniref:T6SS immunity protein Tli4 family protein n=1 Tax=Cupriavidus sp. SZY C1 TaxID=3055037 RepID=UPI0028BB3580|nr:T6SS immunity protein Tli4 family protein [Cupriavidus sp. SZY C1]MDT6964216.1 T6SS immunity protein Tli4 family protein [Cupriavidus sp. SZY C1]
MTSPRVTRAIGRHLVDLPPGAETLETYSFNEVPIELRPDVQTLEHFQQMVAKRERYLRESVHEKRGAMFVRRATHKNGAVSLVSWAKPYSEAMYHMETYFRIGSGAIAYAGDVSPDLVDSSLGVCEDMSGKWRDVQSPEIPSGIGFVAGDCMFVDKTMNLESWDMQIHLAGKPDVSFRLTSYAQYRVEDSLRDRAGGILAGLLGAATGVSQLRNRRRPVGPIEADEILIAGTQDGKRTYGFKWEAPGKAASLAEPNLNVSMRVGQSAYPTNNESFADDDEALAIWDAVVESIRLRPGAA